MSPSSGLAEGNGQPDLEVRKDIGIDWTEVGKDLRDKFLEPYGGFVDYVMDTDVRYDRGSDLVTLLLPVSHKTTKEIVAVLAQIMLKEVSTSVSTQNFYYEAPEKEDTDGTHYGSYFNDRDVLMQVFSYDKKGETGTYLVNDTAKAGEQRALVVQN